MSTDLNTMRADYVLVRRWWKDAEGWTEAELAEADRGVRLVVERKDAELIACWAGWLATLAEDIRRFESSVRDAEGRMRTPRVDIRATPTPLTDRSHG